jgi:hypothetical protein
MGAGKRLKLIGQARFIMQGLIAAKMVRLWAISYPQQVICLLRSLRSFLILHDCAQARALFDLKRAAAGLPIGAGGIARACLGAAAAMGGCKFCPNDLGLIMTAISRPWAGEVIGPHIVGVLMRISRTVFIARLRCRKFLLTGGGSR